MEDKENSKKESENSIVKFIYYLKETLEHDYIENIAVKFRSKVDMDILIGVSDPSKILPVIMMIESNLYTRPMLHAKKVARGSNYISVLTESNETIKIWIYTIEVFNELTQGKVK
jgi:hypothetical protein